MDMTGKERVKKVLSGEVPDRTPVGFWSHFPRECFHGAASIREHIAFYRRTHTDILKIMNENWLYAEGPIATAADWRHVKPIRRSSALFQDQIDIVKGVADALGDEACIVASIYNTTAEAVHCYVTGRRGEFKPGVVPYNLYGKLLPMFLREDPVAVGSAFRAIGESLAELAAGCIEAGAHGVYLAVSGAERFGFTREEYEKYVSPADLMVLEAAKGASVGNILHICKTYPDYTRFGAYRGTVKNWGQYTEGNMPLEEGRKVWPGDVILGGFDDRSGVLVEGSAEEIRQETFRLLDLMGTRRYILGADCTLPTDIAPERIHAVIAASEEYAGRSQS